MHRVNGSYVLWSVDEVGALAQIGQEQGRDQQRVRGQLDGRPAEVPKVSEERLYACTAVTA